MRIYLIALMIVAVVGTGCTAPAGGVQRWEALMYVPDARSVPRVAVYGSLGDLLPAYEATPAIERFLYGPNDFGKTALRNPQGMALLGKRLLVCDQGQPDVIAIHLGTGQSMPWGVSEQRPRCPVDVTVAEDLGRVFVADTTLRSILVFDADEHFVEALIPPAPGDRGFRPCAVLVHGAILYVANVGGRRIERWDMTRRAWLTPFAPPDTRHRLIAPTGLCVTGDGVLWIADAVQGRVYRVTTQGQWLAPVGRPGRGEGEFVRPKQICCVPGGLIFVSDAGRQSVLVFESTGQYRAEIHERADRWEGWTLPMGLLAMSPSDLAPLRQGDENSPAPAPDAYVLVSDSLGGAPLTLLGVVVQPEEASADAG